MLLERPGHRVVLAVRLERASADPLGVGVRSAEPAQVDHPQVVGRCPIVHPLRERLPCTPAGSDAECVEAGTDEEVGKFRRFTEDEVAIRA
jgi:hypothetical protein